jgi:ATP-dependent RNA circularization protein (DNA/RNA ligase family)
MPHFKQYQIIHLSQDLQGIERGTLIAKNSSVVILNFHENDRATVSRYGNYMDSLTVNLSMLAKHGR